MQGAAILYSCCTMKKSEAYSILGLSDGVTDEAIKQAHRKLVIAHHPDKFPLDSKERVEAEERTKQLNEARDVLLNRSWTPEFDPRRDPRPYANPYAHPYRPNPSGSPSQSSGQGGGQDPFAGWPFGQGQGQGQTTYVWTSWGDERTGGEPFDPFAPFRASVPQKTPAEVLAEAMQELKSESIVLGGKVLLLAAALLFGSMATGLFLYVMVSIVYGLWKRLGSCLIGFIIPIALIGAPFVFMIAPRQGAVTIGLGVFFLIAILFDLTNMRKRIQAYRGAKAAAS